MIRADRAAPGTLERRPAVAGTFYPGSAAQLEWLVTELFAQATMRSKVGPSTQDPGGLLVPHAGLEFSGVVAAAGWMQLPPGNEATVVILGTNHTSAGLVGVGVWDHGAWLLPTGQIEVDERLATSILALGEPFAVDLDAHLSEHSIEVQLPLLHARAPSARIVPLAIATGRGHTALEAGVRLGRLLADERANGHAVVLAISTDMAHYPPARVCADATAALAPLILAVDGARLDALERQMTRSGLPGLVCGMCGIDPTIVGLAALSTMGDIVGTQIMSATSAEMGGPSDQTVGYFAARFDAVPVGDV